MEWNRFQYSLNPSTNGFSSYLIDQCTRDFLAKKYKAPDEPLNTVNKKSSYLLAKRLRQYVAKFYPCAELKVVFKSRFSIKDLFRFKDVLPLECRSGVIYYTKCKKCGPSAAYLGKTKNTVYERFYGSNGHLNAKTGNSALHLHISEMGDPECEFIF